MKMLKLSENRLRHKQLLSFFFILFPQQTLWAEVVFNLMITEVQM